LLVLGNSKVVHQFKSLKYMALILMSSTATLAAEEMTLQCDTVTEAHAQRVVCEQRPLSQIKIQLPPIEPPPITITAPGLREVRTPPAQEKTAQEKAASAVEPAKPTSVQTAEMPTEVMQAALTQLGNSKRLDKPSFDELSSFYKERNFNPLWLKKEAGQTAWLPQVKGMRKQLAFAEQDGLDIKRYPSVAAILETSRTEWPALAAAEVELSASLILYAHDLSLGRVAPRQVHAMITPNLERAAVSTVLKNIADSTSPETVMQSFAPQHEGYKLLRQRLADIRKNQSNGSDITIPDGPVLRVGMRDQRVPLLRLKLGLEGTGDIYDRAVSDKIADLQRAVRLRANGMTTPQTLRALNGAKKSLEEAEIITNMEFWRWLPRDLGKDHIFVNVPSLGLQFMRNDQLVHEARVIVGADETQTPIFSDQMDHIVVNPSWFVPPSILKKDPRYLDPEWVKSRGYTMIKRRNSVIVRVPPGASNALGYVKFMFPNDHAVYLHDTPQRRLFNLNNRILSNGCVRVENPFKLAAKIFESSGWSEDRFRRMIGSGEQRMNLPEKLPIHLAYLTLQVKPDGNLVRHRDVYGHATRLRQLLGLS
jgi:L,D-transpeptidase YcbB